jgi:hypothetical protein
MTWSYKLESRNLSSDHNLHPTTNLSSRRLLPFDGLTSDGRLSTLLSTLKVRLTVQYGKGRSMVACGDDS